MVDFCDLEGFDRKEIEELVGIRLKDDGNHIFISDEMEPTVARKDGEKRIDVLMRLFNFNWAVAMTYRQTKLKGSELIRAALNYAKQNCFNERMEPLNMAKMSGYTSYSKFNEFVEESLK